MKTFIFPVHNEAAILHQQIENFSSFLINNYKKKFEIILVENGSTDNSWSIAKKLEHKFSFLRAHRMPEASYGGAIRWGILNALGNKIFVLNVDYFDYDFIFKADALLNTLDLVVGSKTLVNSNDKRPFYRRIGTYLFNVFLRLVLNYPGTDTHGIKAFRRSQHLINFVKTCRTQNELLDTELILKLTRNGAIFVDLPQQVAEIRPSRYFGLRRFKSTLIDLLSIIKTKYFFKKVFVSSIIDADDYGISKKVNDAILHEAKNQGLDIVSIMANLVKKNDLLVLKKNVKNMNFALHFNLLRGKPVSDLTSVQTLVNGHGEFYSLPFFMMRLILGMINLDEVKHEFWSQYRRLVRLGVSPVFLNSEQHLHIFSPLNKMLEREIRETSIKKIRSSASSFHSLNNKLLRKLILILLKNICIWRFSYFDEFKKKYDAYIVHPGMK